MNLGAFDKLDQKLTESVFDQFSVEVTLEVKDKPALLTQCVVDQNPELYSPFEGETVETIITFMFVFDQVGKIPKGSVITLGTKKYEVDRHDHNNKRLRGHSEGDGSTVTVIARPIDG